MIGISAIVKTVSIVLVLSVVAVFGIKYKSVNSKIAVLNIENSNLREDLAVLDQLLIKNNLTLENIINKRDEDLKDLNNLNNEIIESNKKIRNRQEEKIEDVIDSLEDEQVEFIINKNINDIFKEFIIRWY